MRKVHTVLLALGLFFLVFLIARTGVRQLWRELTMLGWGIIPLILAEGIAEFFHAISWRYCFMGTLRDVPLLRLFRIHLAGYAVNFFTPTASVAGDATKAALLAEQRKGTDAVAAVIIGKLSFALSHLLFVIVGAVLVLPGLQWSPALRMALMLGITLLGIGIIIFFLLQKSGNLAALPRWLVTQNICAENMQRFVRGMEEVDRTLKVFYLEHPWNLARSVFWHLLGYCVGIFMTWYFLFLVAAPVPVMSAARVWFLAMWIDLVTFAVPMNLGVLEGGRLVAFRMAGFGDLSGMSFGLVTRAAQLFWAGVGLVAYALLITGPRSTTNSIQQQHRAVTQPIGE